ncbi:MAG: DUF1963 domain-containing protein, partial [Chitinophagia bacterium]|nr:DUF1963 domain-containing protein [Chitinophagia bacterium]
DYLGLHDYRYTGEPDIEAIIDQHGGQREQLEDFMLEHFLASGHKIGGYACFTRSDPREGNEAFRGYELLLQMDSEAGIMWGLEGVANFFIHPDDLARLDFSKVVYTWDW